MCVEQCIRRCVRVARPSASSFSASVAVCVALLRWLSALCSRNSERPTGLGLALNVAHVGASCVVLHSHLVGCNDDNGDKAPNDCCQCCTCARLPAAARAGVFQLLHVQASSSCCTCRRLLAAARAGVFQLLHILQPCQLLLRLRCPVLREPDLDLCKPASHGDGARERREREQVCKAVLHQLCFITS